MNLNKENLLYGRVIAGKGCVELGAFVQGSPAAAVATQRPAFSGSNGFR